MTQETMCTVHPDQAAVGTCERCGLFGCVGCLGVTSGERLCPSCERRRLAELPSLGRPAAVARSGLYMMAALHLCLAVLGAAGVAGVGTALRATVGALFLPLFIGTIIAFLRWFHLAVRYAQALGRPVAETPGNAVFAWFIPLLNLIKPFDLTRRMNRSALVGPWQVCWVAGNMTSNFGGQVGFMGPLSAAFLVAAALLGAEVVKQVSASLTAPSLR